MIVDMKENNYTTKIYEKKSFGFKNNNMGSRLQIKRLYLRPGRYLRDLQCMHTMQESWIKYLASYGSPQTRPYT